MNLVPQFGFLELILIAIVALIVVGPNDLPRLMRNAGKFVAKARRMASEFTAAFDQMAREAEMEEMRQEIEALKKANPVVDLKNEIDDAVAPLKSELNRAASDVEAAANKPAIDVETAATAPAPVKDEVAGS